ncbi:MAG: RDD family protein [Lacunisphaera sp.]
MISAATLPRVGFWLRLVASFLDFIMVAIVIGMLSKVFHGWFAPGGSVPFWFAVYCVIMWATKGTTIGGIICGLKVVRLDDRPIDWGVAIVRALGGFLSFAIAGLGFIWVVFDDDRQSWARQDCRHDDRQGAEGHGPDVSDDAPAFHSRVVPSRCVFRFGWSSGRLDRWPAI